MAARVVPEDFLGPKKKKSVSDPEHPSGLRDALMPIVCEMIWGKGAWPFTLATGYTVRVMTSEFTDRIESAFVAWLSVVSEEERDAVARAIDAVVGPAKQVNQDLWFRAADAALAASREVLIPKEPTYRDQRAEWSETTS
jgi:hypothetical protein